jgi:hypothetical protein
MVKLISQIEEFDHENEEKLEAEGDISAGSVKAIRPWPLFFPFFFN